MVHERDRKLCGGSVRGPREPRRHKREERLESVLQSEGEDRGDRESWGLSPD